MAIQLIPVQIEADRSSLPRDVRAFIDEANRRIERFQIDHHVAGFVASDFASVYAALRRLAEFDLARGSLFCEWGSGFGVVACLAAMLDFDAWGIEIDPALVGHAQQLAADFDVPARFHRGSFIPPGSETCFESKAVCAWLTVDEGDLGEEPELAPDDFDVIFAYPWPDEEGVIELLFTRHARPGALLVTYHGGDEVRVQRAQRTKKRGKTSTSQRRPNR